MECDFSGYATKAGLLCSDGRTITPEAFKHQDTVRVPLVYQHNHSNPENVLGHCILEARQDGMYAYGFFNKTPTAQHMKEAVDHKDITMMSIWANQLVERAKMVFHGAIKEVSLVLSGANPGAVIENVTIRHAADGSEDEYLDDEAIIYTGLTLEHADQKDEVKDDKMADTDVEELEHAEPTAREILDSMTDQQRDLLHSLVGKASVGVEDDVLSQAAGDGPSVQEVYDSLNADQVQLVNFMIGQALASRDNGSTMGQSDIGNNDGNNDQKGDAEMGGEIKHNVFEDQGDVKTEPVISHDDFKSIMEDAESKGSLRRAVKAFIEDRGLQHGITDIDVLFPEAQLLQDTPEFNSRRMEWVSGLLNGVRKTPFSRIKTSSADITFEQARAKGYIKGTLKKEEFFGVQARTTTPTTIYKKQKLDRDDVIDITDFDVVVWLKGEMRVMLDEEIGRAILIGDGRDVSDEDKINEQNIRPVLNDHELYTTTVNVNILDASSSMNEVVDAVITNRYLLKGTGTPNFYTTEAWLARFLTLRDGFGRRIYQTVADLAAELRVAAIIPVEVMLDEPDVIGIMFNPVDYTIGADKGGQVSMFDDFDIDYNQQKYLIETRISGCLTKIKSAMVLRSVASTLVKVTPAAPTFDGTDITIVDTTHVTYKRDDTDATVTNGGSPYTLASGASLTIVATPDTGYFFEVGEEASWTFTNDS